MKIMKMKKIKLFYFDTNTLEYKPIQLKYVLSIIVIVIILSNLTTPVIIKEYIESDHYEPNTMVLNVNDTTNNFSEEKLIDLLKTLNVKYPHIVLAQARIESGHYTSKIFKENHNLFGMKEARVRIHTANGTQYNHAFYTNWRESVYDYAFYQCRYLGRVNTEQEYYTYLSQSYAEAPNYVQSLKVLVKREKLKELFNN
jgi:uncharacterized FlgJ-related protein